MHSKCTFNDRIARKAVIVGVGRVLNNAYILAYYVVYAVWDSQQNAIVKKQKKEKQEKTHLKPEDAIKSPTHSKYAQNSLRLKCFINETFCIYISCNLNH